MSSLKVGIVGTEPNFLRLITSHLSPWLSDALAGLIREADEGNDQYDKLVNKLQKEKVVNELLA